MKDNRDLSTAAMVAESIRIVRGKKVLLDSDLAVLYGVTTKRLNEQVNRNRKRFPADFIFRLTPDEMATLNGPQIASARQSPPSSQNLPVKAPSNLRSQIATSRSGHGGRRYSPYAFTEHGAIMVATILNSTRAVELSVYVVRAFVQLRSILASNEELARQFAKLERRVSTHDQAITGILNTIRELMGPTVTKSRPIGFTADLDEKR